VSTEVVINGRKIGPGQPTYIIAEMSCNHHQSEDRAVEIIHAMKEAGADAVKIQTFTPDAITIDCDEEYFTTGKGTMWEGSKLYDLYKEGQMPWEWQPRLKKIADELGMDFFSTPQDSESTDFLEDMGVPAYKIASFELVDLSLVRTVASKGKPVIISTGMASLEEIQDAVDAVHETGNRNLILLKCTSAYPSPPEEANLRTIPDMREHFGVLVGLSDHSLYIAVPIAAVVLGACIVEKHFCLSRDEQGLDTAFSLEPHEFKEMVDTVRKIEKSNISENELDEKILGKVQYGTSGEDKKSIVFRRSLFAVKDISEGEKFTKENIRSIRPGYGLPPKHIDEIIGKKAKNSIKRGTPILWKMIA